MHREPRDGRYGSIQERRDGDTLVVAAFPDVTAAVTEILPRR